MFGRKNPNAANEPDTPEGQASYIPIDDDAADHQPEASAHGSTEADEMLATVRAELDEVNDKWRRALADFQNYQRRALQNEQEARRQGVTAVLNSVIPVLDHFDMALSQSPGDAASAGIIEGVKVIRTELLKALETHGVRVINPAPNAEFDPVRHQALTQQAGEGVEPGRISAVFQPGYELNDRVVRSAKVAVAPQA